MTARAPEREPTSAIVERSGGSLPARAFGTVVHALLEELVRLPGVDTASSAVLAEVAGWGGRALAMLRANGLSRTEAEPQSTEVVRALHTVLQDATGRWVLGARVGAGTEVSWSTWLFDVVRSLRGDRIFRAGAEPGSAEETHLWIVDYKTARHGSARLDEFLAQEKEKYAPQLESYAEVLRKLPGNVLPIRLALYYPLLPRLLWW